MKLIDWSWWYEYPKKSIWIVQWCKLIEHGHCQEGK